MKKIPQILIITSLLLSVAPSDAEAFLLPPFKTDVVNSLQKSFTTIKTKVEKAYKTVMESTFVQTAIQYGEGAKEAYDFVKTTNINSIQNLISQYPQFSDIASKFFKIDIQLSDAKGKATQEISSIIEKNNAKIKFLNIDINKLQEEILQDPSRATINREKIAELLNQKNNLIFDTNNNITSINDAFALVKNEFNRQKDILKSEITSQISQFTSIAKNYDSVDDLKDTLKSLTLGGHEKNDVQSFWANRERYDAMYWQDFNVIMQRTTAIRAELMADNESAEKLSHSAVSDIEGKVPADAIAGIELAKSNMLALINYTELLLQKLKLDVSYDLTQHGFRNTGTATGEINLDNYKYTPTEDNYSVEKVKLEPAQPGESIEGSLTEASKGVFEAAITDNQSSGQNTGGEKTPTTTEGKGENQ